MSSVLILSASDKTAKAFRTYFPFSIFWKEFLSQRWTSSLSLSVHVSIATNRGKANREGGGKIGWRLSSFNLANEIKLYNVPLVSGVFLLFRHSMGYGLVRRAYIFDSFSFSTALGRCWCCRRRLRLLYNSLTVFDFCFCFRLFFINFVHIWSAWKLFPAYACMCFACIMYIWMMWAMPLCLLSQNENRICNGLLVCKHRSSGFICALAASRFSSVKVIHISYGINKYLRFTSSNVRLCEIKMKRKNDVS